MSNLMRAIGIGPRAPTLASYWYVQGANYGVPVPIIYGQNRCSPTMIHLPAQPAKPNNGKGKGTKSGQNYTAPVVFAICEGPITGLNLIWADKNQPSLFSTGVIQQQANENYTVPASAGHIVAVVAGANFQSNVSVYDQTAGVWLTELPPTVSPAPGAGFYQRATGTPYDYYFNAAQSTHSVWITYFYGAAGTDFPGSWVLKLGTTPAQTPWSYLTTNYPGQAVSYPGIAYMAHPAANFPNDNAQQFSYEVEGLNQFGGGIVDANGADILTDFLTNSLHGANFPASALGQLSGFVGSFYNYCAAYSLFSSPVYKDQQPGRDHLNELFEVTNSGPYWSDGLLKVVPFGDTAKTANGFTFTPNNTPLYSLTDVDFLPNRSVTSGQGGADSGDQNSELDPILITRRDPTTIYNMVKVEYMNRAYDYNADFVVAEDFVSEALNGQLPMSAMSLHSITTATLAQQVAQLRLQREVHVTPITYNFVLGYKYSLVEPMDLLDVTDIPQGLSATPVRVMTVEELENEEGFNITAEPFLGVATAVAYPVQSGNGARPNTNAQPGNTTGAFIIEGPAALISAPMELWMGAYGGPQWGGCNVWVSTDNVNYQQIGQIAGSALFGTMQPSGLANTGGAQYPTVDTTNTGTVTVATGRQLASLSAADFAALTYPCIVLNNSGANREWMTFETAALVTGTEYTISHLYRGLYGTAPLSHVAAENFMMVDGSVARLPWPAGFAGQLLYVKLPAFNLFGAQLQDLSTVTPFQYTIGGSPIVGAEPALQLNVVVQSVVGNTTTISIAAIDPAGSSESVSVTYANVNFSIVKDLGTGLTLTSPFTLTAGGAAKSVQLQPNISFSGNCSLSFTATATGRTNGYAQFTVGPSAQNAEPALVIAIGNNNSFGTPGGTDVTAKASAVVSGPSNAASLKWLASTSSQPSPASVIASGAVVSSGAPTFTISDLGVSLNLGDTVYFTGVYYDSSSNAQTNVQGKKTRETLGASKTAYFTAALFQVTALAGGTTGITHPNNDDTEIAPLGVGGAIALMCNFQLPDNSTITSVAAEVFQTTINCQVSVSFVAIAPGTSMGGLPGSAYATVSSTNSPPPGAWQTVTAGASQSTTGLRHSIYASIAMQTGGGSSRFRTFQVTYSPSNTQATV